jgi:hypothetical protein
MFEPRATSERTVLDRGEQNRRQSVAGTSRQRQFAVPQR